MNDKLLKIDVALLILRYGRSSVLEAFANTENTTADELQQRLAAAALKRKKQKPAPPSIMDVVATEVSKREEIGEPLRTLAIDFQNRTFLPHLRDVQRFLDRMNARHGKLKSRTAAAPLLIRALAKLSREDLVRLTAREFSEGRDTDFALLARAIMGGSQKPRNDEDAPQKPTIP